MDFDDTPEEAVYRARVRAFLDEHRDELVTGGPTHRRARPTRASVAAYKRTQAVLHGAGLVGVAWPKECGGQGGTPIQQAIVDQELAGADVPLLVNFVGVGMCGPTIVAHGTDEQKARWLRPMLRADEVWCQLFSEPGAGSDLAALGRPGHDGSTTARGASRARRCGRRAPTTATSGSCSPSPTPRCPSTAGCARGTLWRSAWTTTPGSWRWRGRRSVPACATPRPTGG